MSSVRPLSRTRGGGQGGGQGAALRAIMDQAVSADDWRAALTACIAAARNGDLKALDLLLRYRFGPPDQTVRVEDGPRLVIELPRVGENPP